MAAVKCPKVTSMYAMLFGLMWSCSGSLSGYRACEQHCHRYILYYNEAHTNSCSADLQFYMKSYGNITDHKICDLLARLSFEVVEPTGET